METRIRFVGTGGALFVKFIVGAILSAITLGIYMPWFMADLDRFVCDNTTLLTPKGEVKLKFTGTGGQLFVTFLVGYILTILTLGIYSAWFITDLIRWQVDNTTASGEDGAAYEMKYTGTGGQLLVVVLVGYILTVITIGIYAPWFMCKFYGYVLAHQTLHENGVEIGSFEFVTTGGTLFKTFLVGYLLSIITLGIYSFWFAVNLMKVVTAGIEAKVVGSTWKGDFTGTGGEFLVVNLVGYLLTLVTLGIYGAWYCCNLWRFQIEGTSFKLRP